MKIYFDARMIDHPGIGRYIRCLLPFIAEDKSFDLALLGDKGKIKKFLGIEKNIIDFDFPVYSIQEQLGFIKLKKIIRNDILHIPHYNIPVTVRFNLVVTIHDIIHILYPEGAKSGFASIYMKFMVKKVLKSAKQVICVSQATRDVIEERLLRPAFGGTRNDGEKTLRGLAMTDKSRLYVIYEGVDKIFTKIADSAYLKSIKEKYKLPDRFMLYVGSIRRHKNINAILDSFERFNRKSPDARLVIVGRYSQSIDLNRKNVLYLGEVASDAELAGIYNLASCLINLSLYEGFGLTILEAQKCGLPVICSDIGPHREIGGEGAIFVKPSYIDQLDENLYNVMFNNNIRDMLITKGLENVERFDWLRTAQETIRLYRKIQDEGGDSSRLAAGNAGRGKDPQCFLQNLP